MNTHRDRHGNRTAVKRAVAVCLGLGLAPAVGSAQQSAGAAGQGERPSVEALEIIIVTGTRRLDLQIADSPLPIDIINGEKLANPPGVADMNDVLRSAVPSFNVQRPVTNDGAVFTRAFSLRGLPPDQTLVLVNGKRWHRGATVQTSTIPYVRGSQGADIAAIPTIALQQLEVLRDGASALYGSDAIAGVLNFRLKDDNSGGSLSTRYGQYVAGDGQDILVQGNIGLPFSDSGFANVSVEYTKTDSTSRGHQRPDAQALINLGVTGVPAPAQRWGSPDTEAVRLFLNSGLELGPNTDFYLFGNYSWNTASTNFFYRPPNAGFMTTSVPLTNVAGGPRFSFRDAGWFPGGFTPAWSGTIRDNAVHAGIKGEFASGITYDVSAAYGRNQASYNLSNTVNPSLGPQSPRTFQPGRLEERDQGYNLDLSYPWRLGLASPVSLAWGLEYRRETFEVTTGDQGSWEVGPYASLLDPDTGRRVGLPVGSNGFPGFSPIQAGVFSRGNTAAYFSAEADIFERESGLMQRLSGGVAARYEDFPDFGSASIWKVSSRLDITRWLALRGSVNTGFRAPTVGQSNVFQIQTNINFDTGAPLTTGIVPAGNPVAQLFGARPLGPEDSYNVALGIVLRPTQNWTVTVDHYDIEVENRISLSGNFNLTNAQREQLEDSGVPGGGSFDQVSFFTNAFDTRTKGYDVVSTVDLTLGAGELAVSLNGNYNKTQILRATPAIAADYERFNEYERFVPEWKGSLGFDYRVGGFGFSLKGTYYGEWTDFGTSPDGSQDQTGDAVTFLDAELSYSFDNDVRVAFGGENILDQYPSKEARVSQTNGGITYMRFAPTGFNGGFWYARLGMKF